MGKPPISRATFLEDLVRDYPRLVVPLVERGIVCIKCGTVSWDTLEEAARKAGIEDIDVLVAELQELARTGAGTSQ
jgi:hypothetical protein